jgi:hypothetical protein
LEWRGWDELGGGVGWVAWVRIEPLLKMLWGEGMPHTLLKQEEIPASYRCFRDLAIVNPYRSLLRSVQFQCFKFSTLATMWNKVWYQQHLGICRCQLTTMLLLTPSLHFCPSCFCPTRGVGLACSFGISKLPPWCGWVLYLYSKCGTEGRISNNMWILRGS